MLLRRLSKYAAAILASTVLISPCLGQIGTDDVIIHEFFEDILRVHPGSTSLVFEVERNDNITHIAIANSTTAYVVNFREIWKVDTAAGTVTDFYEVEGVSPSEITIDLDGNVLACTASLGVVRIDKDTAELTTVFDDTFFNPSDICVSSEGNIYTTEFFDGLGVISPGGGWSKLGDWDTNFFQHIDIGPDGYLYCATTFEDGDIYRINPVTGIGQKIGEDVYTFIDDLQVASDGTIFIAGNTDTDGDNLVEDVVLTMDPNNGYAVSVYVDENMISNAPFFNPMDIEIFDDVFYASAPGEFAPEFANVTRGILSSGTVDDLEEGDNVDMVMQRGAANILPRTEVEVMTTSYTNNPEIFEFTLESSVFARAVVNQSIYLFNYDTDEFELVDTRAARRFQDSTVTIEPAGDLSRFVQPGTNLVEAKIRYQSTAQRQQFSSSVDRAVWNIR